MISSELRTQALRLLDHLIRKRLIFGGPVFSGPARFLWKNEVVEHDYCWTITFTRQDLRDELIREVEAESAEAICMIPFTEIPKRTVSSWGDLRARNKTSET